MISQRHTLECFSAYPYPPKNRRVDGDDRYVRLVYALKHGASFLNVREVVSPYWLVADRHAKACPELAGAVVVPVPRSSITPVDIQSGCWPGLHLAEALVKHGTAEAMRPVLRRGAAVPTASQSAGADRPTVQRHIESLLVNIRLINEAEHVVLVDDVLTRGSQMIGAMRAIQLAGYRGTISAFTAAYTDYGNRAIPRRAVITWTEGAEYANPELPPNSPNSLDL